MSLDPFFFETAEENDSATALSEPFARRLKLGTSRLSLHQQLGFQLQSTNQGLAVPQSMARKFASPQHAFLVRRFDRTPAGRLHFSTVKVTVKHDDLPEKSNLHAGLQTLETME